MITGYPNISETSPERQKKKHTVHFKRSPLLSSFLPELLAQSTKWRTERRKWWACVEKRAALTGRVQVNESIKERERSKISMRKQEMGDR